MSQFKVGSKVLSAEMAALVAKELASQLIASGQFTTDQETVDNATSTTPEKSDQIRFVRWSKIPEHHTPYGITTEVVEKYGRKYAVGSRVWAKNGKNLIVVSKSGNAIVSKKIVKVLNSDQIKTSGVTETKTNKPADTAKKIVQKDTSKLENLYTADILWMTGIQFQLVNTEVTVKGNKVPGTVIHFNGTTSGAPALKARSILSGQGFIFNRKASDHYNPFTLNFGRNDIRRGSSWTVESELTVQDIENLLKAID